jgi:hypothetical protein
MKSNFSDFSRYANAARNKIQSNLLMVRYIRSESFLFSSTMFVRKKRDLKDHCAISTLCRGSLEIVVAVAFPTPEPMLLSDGDGDAETARFWSGA